MKAHVITCLLIYSTITIRAQEAHLKYMAEMSRIESLGENKSTERGKALAAFYEERKKEAGLQTAEREATHTMLYFMDYDTRAVYEFLLKVATAEEAKKLVGYLTPEGRTIVRVMASHTVNNWKTGSGFPDNIPQSGYGLKGAWINPNPNRHNVDVIQTQTDDGNTEMKNGYSALRAQRYAEALDWFRGAADKGSLAALAPTSGRGGCGSRHVYIWLNTLL